MGEGGGLQNYKIGGGGASQVLPAEQVLAMLEGIQQKVSR